ncbi:hypothetical protein [Rugamonas sp. DEMB1]|uniref:hypothetical protein n=1 Tax=Rugamonas sp. DEMB1 TaxID=3039386 RepID=UPI00244818A4|nr:hypothetical protein [Rugamonas sp. DEMB1]WGG52279.1 hypothetical protein QC826_09015 [Rugamonas sp. DEMB1]
MDHGGVGQPEAELVAGQVVAAAGEQDGVVLAAVVAGVELGQQAVQLGHAEHVLGGLAVVGQRQDDGRQRHRLEVGDHVARREDGQRIVEPAVALGDQVERRGAELVGGALHHRAALEAGAVGGDAAVQLQLDGFLLLRVGVGCGGCGGGHGEAPVVAPATGAAVVRAGVVNIDMAEYTASARG